MTLGTHEDLRAERRPQKGQEQAGPLWRVPGLAPILGSAFVARTGAMGVTLTLLFVAYDQTESAFWVAAVAAAFGLGFASSSLLAGHVVQRIGLRAMMTGAALARIVEVAVLASVIRTAGNDVTWLIVFSAVGGLAAALLYVGMQLLINALAPRDRLDRVLSVDAAGASVADVAGPALAGILVQELGVPPVLLLAAVGYVPLMIVVVTFASRVRRPDSDQRRARLRDAVHLIRQLPLLRWAVLTTVLVQLLALPLVDMMPVVTDALSRDAADRLGVLTACIAFGSIGQVVIVGRLHERWDARVVVGIMFAATGVLLVGIALDQNLFLVGLLLVAFGLAVSVGKTLLLTSVHLGAPDSHRHHVLSMYVFITALALPLSTLVWGTTAEFVGIHVTIAGAGILLIAAVAGGMVSVGRHDASAWPSAAAVDDGRPHRAATA